MSTKKPLVVLADIQDLLTRPYPNTREFLNQVLAKANELIGSDSGFIGLVQYDAHGRRVVRVWDRLRLVGARAGHWDRYIRDLPVGTRDLRKGERSLVGRVAYLRQPRRVGNVRRALFFRRDVAKTRSELAAPVICDRQVLAVLNLESRKLRAYSRDDEDILNFIARMIAPRLQQLMASDGLLPSIGDLFQQMTEKLQSVAPGPLDSHSFDEAARLLAGWSACSQVRIWLLTHTATVLSLRGSFGARPPKTRRLGGRSTHDPLWRAVLCQSAVGVPQRRTMMIPILGHRGISGAIEVVDRRASRRHGRTGVLSQREVEGIQVVQGQLAALLEIRSLQASRTREALHQTQRLSRLAGIFSRTDLDRTLQSVVTHIPKLMGCHGCSIFLWDAERRSFTLRASNRLAASGEPEETKEYLPFEGLTGWVAETGRSLNLQTRTKAELTRVDKTGVLFWKNKYLDAAVRRNLRLQPFMAVPVFVGGRSRGVIRLSDRREPGPFSESDLELLTAVATHVSSLVAYQKQGDGRLRGLADTLRELTVSLREGLKNHHDNFDAPLDLIVSKALEEGRRAMNADVLTLYEYDSDRKEILPALSRAGEIRDANVMGHRLYPGDAPWRVLRAKRPQFWGDVVQVRAFRGRTPVRGGFKSRARFCVREGIKSAAGLPLEVAGAPVGILFVNFRQYQAFERGQREFIENFAGVLALTMEVVRLYRLMRMTTSREVKAGIAYDLHDMLTWYLQGPKNSNLLNVIDRTRERIRTGQLDLAVEGLENAERATLGLVAALREMIGLLMEGRANQRGLLKELERERVSRQWTGLSLPPHNVPLPRHLKYHFYRIILTAVSNAFDKGHAAEVAVEIERRGDRVSLRITDDGCGFDVNAALAERGPHYGLRSIERRAHHLQGNTQIESTPGVGSTIVVEVPLHETRHVA